jgi:hypothetical protein
MMKERSEEDIQRMLEQQFKENRKQADPADDDKDVVLYRLLFTALTDEPDTLKGTNLAETVVKQIQTDEKKAESFRYNMVIAGTLIAGVVSAYFSLNYIDPVFSKSVLHFIDTYKWTVLFIALCVTAIEIADKNLVKRKFAI